MTPFPMIELAAKELIEQRLFANGEPGTVGGDLSYKRGDGLYVWIGMVPGGQSDQTEGTWLLDIDTFADDYVDAMQASLALEAAFLARPYGRTSSMRIDSITQNQAPAERPWEDDGVFRVGALYVFTARRSG